MYSTKYSVSVHILSMIALKKEKTITSEYIACSVNTNPALVRRLMSTLKRAGLIKSQTKIGVIGLTKSPDEISLLEIFRAVEKEQRLFAIHTDTNDACPVGAKIGNVLEYINTQVQSEFEQKLDSILLSDILEGLHMNEEEKN